MAAVKPKELKEPASDIGAIERTEARGEPQGTDYVCGLRKVGPSKYSLVKGRVVDGVPALTVDPISQSLDHASEELRAEFQRMMEVIP